MSAPVEKPRGGDGKLLRIATRGSKLALWQAGHIAERLRAAHPSLTVETLVLKTEGDRVLDRPLSEIGGKGLFVKEIEEALLDGRADVAVHSMKDLPAELAPGLRIAAVPEREDPRDALLVRPGLSAPTIAALPHGARVGTSSLRRLSLVCAQRPDLAVSALRGNVDTRLRKLDDGEYDAIVLAVAGLKRLGFQDRIAAALGPPDWIPAIGQGALAVEARSDDAATLALLSVLDHPDTAVAVRAERAFLIRLGGSCRTPMAAHATLSPMAAPATRLRLEGLVGRPDGTLVLRDHLEGATADADALGLRLAERLIAAGASAILAACVATSPVGGA